MIICAAFLSACARADSPTETLSPSAVWTTGAATASSSAGAELDGSLPVAAINGKSITRGEWLQVYQNYYYMLVYYYGVDPSTEEGAQTLEEYKTLALDLLIAQTLLEDYARKEGYTQYTQAQRQEAEEYAAEQINSLIEQKKQELEEAYTGEEEIDFFEQAKQSVEEELSKAGKDIQSIAEDYLLSDAMDRCYEDIVSKADVTEEDILEYYNALVKEQKEYDAEEFVALFNQSEEGILCYIPEGYMLAQHILIGFEETEQLTVMSAYQTVYFAEQDIVAKQTEITEAAEEDKAELEAELAELEAELKTAREEYASALEQASKSIQSKAMEIYKQVRNAGADVFEETALEQSSDAQGQESLSAYLVGEGDGLITEFHDTALALKTDGEISEPVLGPYGYHIIRRVNELNSGMVPVSEVRQEIIAALKGEKETELFDKTLEAWKEQSEIIIYAENMVYSA